MIRVKGSIDVTLEGVKAEDEPVLIFHFANQEPGKTMANAVASHDLKIGGGILVVKVFATRAGKRLDQGQIRVVNVAFNPDGIAEAELQEDGSTIHFRPLGTEGETTATVEVEFRAKPDGPPTDFTKELLLNATAPEEVPDAIDFDITEEPAPENPPAPEPGPAPAPAPAALGPAVGQAPGGTARPPGRGPGARK